MQENAQQNTPSLRGGGASEGIERAAELIRGAERCVVFTGAGMSADSGVATFRKAGSQGIWGGMKGTVGLAYFGTPIGWRMTPGLAWKMYCGEFYTPIAQAEPHPGHEALARLEKEKFGAEKLCVVTMNVDGFHTRAGNTNVAEVHGTVERVRCAEHGKFPMPRTNDPKKVRCPTCNKAVRPDVVLFTEELPEDEWVRATGAAMALGVNDVMLVIGTTGAVYPAAGLPEAAIRRGVKVIEVNFDESPISSSVDVFLKGRAGEIVPKLVDMALS